MRGHAALSAAASQEKTLVARLSPDGCQPRHLLLARQSAMHEKARHRLRNVAASVPLPPVEHYGQISILRTITLKPTRIVRLHAALLAATVLAVPTAEGQSTLRSAPSTRAAAEVVLSVPRPQGDTSPAPAPIKLKIDYGQPHARGRAVAGALAADLDKVWRLGANNPTTFSTDVDLVMGGTTVPKGSYVLWAETSSKGPWKLIINSDPGAEHKPDRDVVRVPLTTKTLTNPIESLTISLVPGPDGAPNGDLRIMWGTREFTTTWALK